MPTVKFPLTKMKLIALLIFMGALLSQGGAQTSQPNSTGPATPGFSQTATPPAAASQAAQRRTVIPDTFTNLKVLPKDIKKPELVQMMKGFAIQLGKRCKFCHEVNDDLSEGNFASDKKIEKETARVMIKMMAELNNEFLAKLPEMPAEATCWTCHRGKNKPEKFTPPEPGAGQSKPPSGANAPPDAHIDAQHKDASPNTRSTAPPK